MNEGFLNLIFDDGTYYFFSQIPIIIETYVSLFFKSHDIPF